MKYYIRFLKFKSLLLGFPQYNESVIEVTLIKYSNIFKLYIFHVLQKEVTQIKTIYYKNTLQSSSISFY